MNRAWKLFQFACTMLVIGGSIVFGLSIRTGAATPGIINYQGRVQSAGGVDFTGNGLFKFALVNGGGTLTYWSNDGTSNNGSEPAAAVSVSVSKGLYAVVLGDPALPNMTVIPAIAFSNTDVRLRIWFNDGTNGSQLLTPDQRITAAGYALNAAGVDDGSITSSKLASGSVTLASLETPLQNAINPTGTVLTFAGAAVPAGYLPCDGSAVSRTTFAALFAVIGTTHGSGDGVTTFNIPDYRGRFLRGVDGVAGNDPDSAARTASGPGGNTGNAVGSVQADMFASHTHGMTGQDNHGPFANVGDVGSGTAPLNFQTAASGGNETRPKNAYVNFIIKY